MNILTRVASQKDSTYEVSLMSNGCAITHLHINNHKTNDQSVLVPINLVAPMLATVIKKEDR